MPEGHSRRVVAHDAVATTRPDILDRNGEILATDVRTPSLFAEPQRIIDVDEASELLTAVMTDIDAGELRERLSSKRRFVWLKREITAKQREQIHRLGVPGFGFLPENKRTYPNGAEVAHLIGLVNVDNQGIAGIEKWLDSRGLADLHLAGLATDRLQKPIELAVDLRVQHAGEIEPLTGLVRPHVAIVTTVEPVHLEFFGSVEAIADAKAEIFLGLEPDGAAVLNRDNPHFARLERSAREAGTARIVSFGEHERADARLMKCSLQPDSSTVQARILGSDVTYKLGAPGRHLVLNSLAVLATVVLLGADLALAALALAELRPASGRGARMLLACWQQPQPARSL